MRAYNWIFVLPCEHPEPKGLVGNITHTTPLPRFFGVAGALGKVSHGDQPEACTPERRTVADQILTGLAWLDGWNARSKIPMALFRFTVYECSIV